MLLCNRKTGFYVCVCPRSSAKTGIINPMPYTTTLKQYYTTCNRDYYYQQFLHPES